jgi:putative photosynthetic complex assembly protein 2
VARSSLSAQVSGVYLGFAASVALWGAVELSFLSGLATGPRRRSCGEACRGWGHFVHAVQALLYHELALAGAFAAVAALSWNRANPTAACTFGVLWVMRESAKLNLFLGVRNPAVELLPRQLAHLRCYFGTRPINAFFPLSVAAALLAVAKLLDHTFAPGAMHPDRIAGLMLATLLALAILEHLVMLLPVRADALWIWATRRSGPARTAAGDGQPAAVLAASDAPRAAPTCRLEPLACITAQIP